MRTRLATAVLGALGASLAVTAPASAESGCDTGMNDFDGDAHKDVVIGAALSATR